MSNQPKVVITDFIEDDLAIERRVLGQDVEIIALNAFSEAEMAGRIEDADAIMMYHNIGVSRLTIERLTRCKLIVRCGVGVDNVDHAFAATRGIPVANVPDYGTEDVADTAISMALSLVRGVHLMNSKLRAGSAGTDWHYTIASPVYRLRGRVYGIIGLGRIGTATALRAKAMGCDVAFYDPYKADGWDKAIGIRRVEKLEELLDQSFVISLHVPLTDETRHMIDANALARMQRGSYLVNTARGAVVDANAIPDAIASGQLAGAGIDVLEGEPPTSHNPLIRAWRDPAHAAHHRVIINPHAAFYSEEGLLDMREKGAEACRRALAGEPLRNVVNGIGVYCPPDREY